MIEQWFMFIVCVIGMTYFGIFGVAGAWCLAALSTKKLDAVLAIGPHLIAAGLFGWGAWYSAPVALVVQ